MAHKNMNLKTKIITILVAVFLFSAITTSLNAAPASLLGPDAASSLTTQDQAFFDASGLGSDASVGEIAAMVIKIVLSLLGLIFIILIIYAGLVWMTSAGNEEKISKAKKVMGSSFIGLAIVLAAYSITYFVIDKMLEATTGGSGLDTWFWGG